MSDILQKHRTAVRTEGELVVLQFGNVVVKMPYDTALQVSTWMRVRAKEAKRNAGDTSRHWTVIGNLQAVEQEGRPW